MALPGGGLSPKTCVRLISKVCPSLTLRHKLGGEFFESAGLTDRGLPAQNLYGKKASGTLVSTAGGP